MKFTKKKDIHTLTKFNSIDAYIKSLNVGSFIYTENILQKCNFVKYVNIDVIESHLNYLAETTNLVKKDYRVRCLNCGKLNFDSYNHSKAGALQEAEICKYCGTNLKPTNTCIEIWYERI